MITKKSLISAVLLVGFTVMPFKAQAGILDIFDPLKVNRIIAKAKANPELVIEEINKFVLKQNLASTDFALVQNDSVLATRSPITPKTYKPKMVYVVAATGYSSTPEQTDDTPFITASGTHVRDGVIAANFLPIGTIIKIPELFGDKTFIVEDRMNSRYWLNIDIWFSEKYLAKEFGLKVVKIEIIS
jgi:3D (Asp-Asp-Asp) domain-containing protein